ncbi:MAG: hypothetical protein HQL32_08870 [Planctomycetes bacterium]|nr:hypothetical protein [Planctomycetota bacterium]
MTRKIEAIDIPIPMTQEFLGFIQNWRVVVVWDKDHTMVNYDNEFRPKLKENLLAMKKKFPRWRHVILTENTLESVYDMFDKEPGIEQIFDMILCDDNFFSRKAIRQYFIKKKMWFSLFGRTPKRERTKRKNRRVNDIFLGKKVVLIDDLRNGRVPEHSFCVTCKLWTGDVSHEDEINWPDTLEESILGVLKRLYHYEPNLYF